MIELRNGDLFGTPPSSWIARQAMKVVGAKTFHWGMIIGRDKDGYIVSESIGKGTVITRLTAPMAYVYRIKSLKHEPETYRLVSFHSWVGEYGYDVPVNFVTTIWFLFKHYLKIVLPVVTNHTYNCQEHVIYMSAMLGAKIIPEDEYPYSRNLEKSEALEYLGEIWFTDNKKQGREYADSLPLIITLWRMARTKRLIWAIAIVLGGST